MSREPRGTAGFGGDGGPATDAELNNPAGLAVTADGGFLIADTANQVVRKVSADAVITRVAGTDNAGSGGDDGPATDAELNNPAGLAVVYAIDREPRAGVNPFGI